MNQVTPKSFDPAGSIALEVICDPGRGYKSIGSLAWNGIPYLAVLTGPNGSGKTQLLELLAHKLTSSPLQIEGVQIKITGASYSAASVAYLPSDWQLSYQAVGLEQLRAAKDQVWDQVQNPQRHTHDFKTRARVSKWQELVSRGAGTREAFLQRLPDDFSFMLSDTDVTDGIAHVFVSYRLRVLEAADREDIAPHKVIERIGPPPWSLLDNAFEVAGFPFRVVPPSDTSLADVYHLRLRNLLDGQTLTPSELSSGEKMILVIVMWLFKSQHYGVSARLLLMDEPDAHLHPAMTRQFLDVLHKVLVQQHGVRVIMTTHSPSTVAMAPGGSVFEMSRTRPRISPSISSASTVGLLAAGLVVVSTDSRFVLVEDQNDVRFYNAIRAVLTDYGPGKDRRALAPTPSLLFLPASTGAGSHRTPGGNTVVQGWVAKLADPPLRDFVRGVIDLDNGNICSDRVKVISRHSIENYLADPLVTYCLLSTRGMAPHVPSVDIARGNEHLLQFQHPSALQDVVNAMCDAVEKAIHLQSGTAPRTVAFTNGVELQYPEWMISTRGHDLFAAFQQAFGGSSVINYQALEGALVTLRIIPVDLADVLHDLQRI